MKSAVAKIILFLLLVSMLMSWLLLTQSGLNWVYQRAKIYLPDGLIVAAPQGRLMGPMTLHNVAYQQPEAYIKTGEIVVDWHLTALLTGSIDITQLQVQGLQIVLPETETQPTTSAPNQTSDLPEINLPWRVSLAALQISEIDIKYGEQQLQLQQITLNASTLFNRINIKQLAIRGDNFLFNISGELQTSGSYRHQLDTDWQFTLPTHVAINGRGQVRGDLKQIQINQQLTGPLQLTLNAQLNDVLHKINWHANVDVSAFNAAQLLANLPALSGQLKLQAAGDLASANVTGKLTGEHPDTGVINADFQLTKNADNTIHIEQLALQLPAHRTRLKAHGQWLPDANGGAIKLALDWKKLRWPMQGTPWFDSASGHGTIDGTLNHYAITLATESPWPEAAPSYWHASAEGDLDGMTFHNLRVNALDGAAVATGQIKWAPTFSWQANVHASDINPAQRWPDWPGKLQAQLRTQGHMKNDAIVADVDIEKLTGELRGYPVSLRSQFQWHDAGIDFAQFDFHSATALVSASGRVGEISNLDWDISAANLAEIYPLAQGEFTASGRLAGQWDAPLVEATLQGKAIVIPDYKIGTIDGRLKLDLLHWRQIDIHLAAQALNLNGYPLQSLDLTADSQQLQAHIVSALANLQLEVNGAVAADGWQGTLTRADIQSTQFTDWQLQAPVALNFNANSLQLNSLCWRNPQQASVCTGLTWQDSWWKSQIKLTQFPLQVFSPWLPPDLKLEGTADASAELQLKLPDQLHGNVRIDLTPGAVSYPVQEGERAHWAYASGLLTLLLDEHGLQASTEIDLQNGDALRLNASLPGARVLALSPQQSLHGEVAFKLHDLGLFEVLVPEIQDLKGEVAVNLAASGTLGQPRFSGQASLNNAAFRIPRLGLNIDQFNLQGQADGLEKISLQLAARSGEGQLAMRGETRISSADGWSAEFTIRGDHVEVSRIPEARVLASPDLTVKLSDHNINITGNLEIPSAKLQPKDLTTAASVSDDVVIVGGAEAAQQKWSMTSKVRLKLGDKVSFYGFGFEGKLGGSLVLEDEPGQLTTAVGEINIPEGRYRAYGQRLDVERGRLVYAGGPIDNPGLDIRAVRQVNNVTAGVKVKGTLNQPQLELFSTPVMAQIDMLSYLILGRPMETATGEEGAMMANAALALGLSGGDRIARSLTDRFGLDEMRVESSDKGDQASLVVGRYLSPKIYVSYGVGLIESINTFTVRYQISEQWQLKAESGATSGADIFYTIDR